MEELTVSPNLYKFLFDGFGHMKALHLAEHNKSAEILPDPSTFNVGDNLPHCDGVVDRRVWVSGFCWVPFHEEFRTW
jgi:hypothetical protein